LRERVKELGMKNKEIERKKRNKKIEKKKEK
jgi:hypothetical protein